MIQLKSIDRQDLLQVIDYENQYFNKINYDSFIQSFINNPLYSIYGIYKQSSMIGYIIIWLDEDKSQVYSMLIDDLYRRRGYGYMALTQLEDILKEKHIKEWTLEVRESNESAIQLYKKIGFKIVSIRKNYYINNENAFLMYKKI